MLIQSAHRHHHHLHHHPLSTPDHQHDYINFPPRKDFPIGFISFSFPWFIHFLFPSKSLSLFVYLLSSLLLSSIRVFDKCNVSEQGWEYRVCVCVCGWLGVCINRIEFGEKKIRREKSSMQKFSILPIHWCLNCLLFVLNQIVQCSLLNFVCWLHNLINN